MINRKYCRWCKGTGLLTLVTSVVECTECGVPLMNVVDAPDIESASRGTASPAPQATARPKFRIPMSTAGGSIPTPSSIPKPVRPGFTLTGGDYLSPLARLTHELTQLRHELPGMAKLSWDFQKPDFKDLGGQILFPIYSKTGSMAGHYMLYITAASSADGFWMQSIAFDMFHIYTKEHLRLILKNAIAKLETGLALS
jgi:hypothetical protein